MGTVSGVLIGSENTKQCVNHLTAPGERGGGTLV